MFDKQYIYVKGLGPLQKKTVQTRSSFKTPVLEETGEGKVIFKSRHSMDEGNVTLFILLLLVIKKINYSLSSSFPATFSSSSPAVFLSLLLTLLRITLAV